MDESGHESKGKHPDEVMATERGRPRERSLQPDRFQVGDDLVHVLKQPKVSPLVSQAVKPKYHNTYIRQQSRNCKDKTTNADADADADADPLPSCLHDLRNSIFLDLPDDIR
jgi:hypothetical protein